VKGMGRFGAGGGGGGIALRFADGWVDRAAARPAMPSRAFAVETAAPMRRI
jgi:hypothetical protein